MAYDPNDYVMDWRRVAAGYAVALMAIISFYTFDIACCITCSPIQL